MSQIGVKKKAKQLDISTLALLNAEVTDATLGQAIHTHSTSDITGLVPFPPPHLENLIPDSSLPSTTGNFILKGSYYTKEMCDRVNNPNAIIIEGQTINYATYINSQEIHVNADKGAAEGYFDVTLNNGTQSVFTDALLIVLGEVFKPKTNEWTLTEPIGVIDDDVTIETWNSFGYAEWSQEFDYTKDFAVKFKFKRSPLGDPTSLIEHRDIHLGLLKTSDSSALFGWNVKNESASLIKNETYSLADGWTNPYYLSPADDANYNVFESNVFEWRFVSGVMYYYVHGVLERTHTDTLTENLKLKIKLKSFDLVDIKYIELAS